MNKKILLLGLIVGALISASLLGEFNKNIQLILALCAVPFLVPLFSNIKNKLPEELKDTLFKER